MKFGLSEEGELRLGRVLLLVVVVTMLLSTTLSLSVEGITYVVFVTAPTLRRRFLGAIFGHPLCLLAMPFGVLLVVGVLHGPASWMESLTVLFGWRRLFFIPFALAVFIDAPSKRLALKVVLLTCFGGALLSFVTAAGSIELSFRLYPGIVFHNYATQGLILSVGATIAVAALLRPDAFVGDRLLGNRWLMAGMLAALVVDVVFVLSGRTGYLAIIVMSVAAVILLAPGTRRMKLAAGAAILIACLVVMTASPHLRGRLAQTWDQIESVDQAAEGTSVGTRIVMWRNTLRMAAGHPLFGVGLGSFQLGYAGYVRGVDGWRGQLTDDPHNQFLKIQGELGLVGLAAFLLVLSTAFRCPAPTPYRELAAAVLIGWCATSMANSDFSTQVEARMIYFWLGAMLGGAHVGRRGESATEPAAAAEEAAA